jgi:signal peptidase I
MGNVRIAMWKGHDMMRWIKDNRGLLIFVLCLGLFRTAIADWNYIPSASMRPNLLEGDMVLVNRLAYDFKLPLTDIVLTRMDEPRRGDIVVFRSPKGGTRLIKRIIALPGDRVEMRNEVLIINGVAATYHNPEALQETMAGNTTRQALRLTEVIGNEPWRIQLFDGVPAPRFFGPVEVPAGSYLMLGDNRDISADSRYFGFVPRNLLIGQAKRILVSADINESWLPRPMRFGQRLQ